MGSYNSRVAILITHTNGLITLLFTTHEPQTLYRYPYRIPIDPFKGTLKRKPLEPYLSLPMNLQVSPPTLQVLEGSSASLQGPYGALNDLSSYEGFLT